MKDYNKEVRDDEYERVVISCPRCNYVFIAEVLFPVGLPFPLFVAECPACKYVVTENDWLKMRIR